MPVPDASLPRRRAPEPPVRAAAGALLVAAALLLAPSARAERVLVVQAADTPRLEGTLAALRKHATLPVDVLRLNVRGEHAVRDAWSASPRGSVLVALGPRASDAVLRLALPGPAVHCLAGADALRAGLPAVASEVPADQQAAWLARLLPSARTVGMLFDPAISTRRVEAQAAALAAAGYRTLLQPVPAPSALPGALDALAGRADVVLALPDGTVYTGESSRGLLMFSFRKRIPLVGPSEAWVKSGSLYALDWDYAEVGAACAALAARLADARRPAPVPPRPRVFVNERSAGHFGIAWPPEVLRQAQSRHE